MTETSIALCAIVKDELRSIVEWLAYHKALGFTDFVLYDNESSDGTEKILQVLDDAGELLRLEWPHSVGERPQRLAYDHMRRNSTFDWIAFFDVDEFLHLRRDRTIAEFLGRFSRDVNGIAVHWLAFNSGGQERYRPAPVIERFTEALPPDSPFNSSLKSIGRREKLAGTGIHSLAVSEGRYVTPSGKDAVLSNGQTLQGRDVEIAVLHHYMVKSREEFEDKRNRGHANSQDPARKRMKLDMRLAEADAPGTPNREILVRSAAMRAEAERLCRVLRDAGLHFPVWPFVEEGDGENP